MAEEFTGSSNELCFTKKKKKSLDLDLDEINGILFIDCSGTRVSVPAVLHQQLAVAWEAEILLRYETSKMCERNMWQGVGEIAVQHTEILTQHLQLKLLTLGCWADSGRLWWDKPTQSPRRLLYTSNFLDNFPKPTRQKYFLMNVIFILFSVWQV